MGVKKKDKGKKKGHNQRRMEKNKRRGGWRYTRHVEGSPSATNLTEPQMRREAPSAPCQGFTPGPLTSRLDVAATTAESRPMRSRRPRTR